MNLQKHLSNNGFNEIMTNSICSPEANQLNNEHTPIEIINPQGIELSNLRVSLLPGMIDTIAFNINRQNKNLKSYILGDNSVKWSTIGLSVMATPVSYTHLTLPTKA